MQPQSSPAMAVATRAPAAHRSKTTVAWLACLLGMFGAHWWYLGRRGAWVFTVYSCVMLALTRLYPVWWDNPAFLLLLLPITEGYIEALVFAVKPDEKFDRLYNPESGVATHTRWGPIFAAIVTLILTGTVVVFGIALTVMYVYIAMGWLDGLQL
jgi:hypothetical protein